MSSKKFCKLMFFLLIAIQGDIELIKGNSAVTYEDWKGRFGDNLFLVAKAKWCAIKHKISFLYKPFFLSDQLLMDGLEARYEKSIESKYERIIFMTQLSSDFHPEPNTLYVIKFYCAMPQGWLTDSFLIDEMKKIVQPCIELTQPSFPMHAVNVAVHVRRGGGFDKHDVVVDSPYKFPPDSFYIQQIKNLCDFYPDQILYIYIFTDDENPAAIMSQYSKAIQQSSEKIIWDYQKNNQDFKKNALDDFFAMSMFDCIIRPESSFSIWAEKLGNFKVSIAPKHIIKRENVWFVDQVKVRTTNQPRGRIV